MEMTLEQKIRVLRNYGRRLSEEESYSFSMNQAMGSGYGGEYIMNYYDNKRERVLEKLNLNTKEIKEIYKDYNKIELSHLKEEYLMWGRCTKVHEDLVGFFNLVYEGV